MWGSASGNSLLVAGRAGLFGTSVVMKKEHQGIRAAIDLYHQIQKEASETS